MSETHQLSRGDAPEILLADDDAGIRAVVGRALGRRGWRVRTTGRLEEFVRWTREGAGHAAVVDVVFPDRAVFEVLPEVRRARPDLPVIVMSARSTLSTAVSAAREGAFDYLAKPFDLEDLTDLVERALAARKEPAVPAVESEAALEEGEALPLVGRSSAMQQLYRAMARVMHTDLTVLIIGESGTGKELVARALHDFGGRRTKAFVPVNMAAIPKDLIESELFGHERGAFTGAQASSEGRFAQAQGGTLFLDEIGDMPFEAQTRLLRVLQDGRYTRVGGREMRRADVRIVAATHQDLRALIAEGRFREDLFYRLNVMPLEVPPLRARLDDLKLLVEHFLAQAEQDGLPRKTVTEGALTRLSAHAWPGNVRELANVVRRLAVLTAEPAIGAAAAASVLAEAKSAAPRTAPAAGVEASAETASRQETLGESVERHLTRYFEGHSGALPPAGLYKRIIQEVERPLIVQALKATGGNQLRAAQLLGLNRNTLRSKIRALGLDGGKGD